ncbi:MAG: tagatose 1,6-diphosphate aldolase [Rhizobiales bacterium]|nr:tagatose 1,6-diphosphate aldolase [Hyphomicrobiales bacterium]
MTLALGKQWSLRRMTDKNGYFKMTSLDQRAPIEDPIKQVLSHSGLFSIDKLNQDVVSFKRLLIETFQSRSSAMLLDPSFAVAGCLNTLDTDKGLFISLEDPYSAKTEQGATITSVIPGWSVGKIKRVGGDAVKLLIWYHSTGNVQVNAQQQQLVRKVGADCVKYDIPFVLELLAYPSCEVLDNTALIKQQKADSVLLALQEFAKEKYQVDVFMLESPVDVKDIGGVNNTGWEEVQAIFDQIPKLAKRPWVMLSMGADMAEFQLMMSHAYQAGCSGYLAGRAYWLDTIDAYPNWGKMQCSLNGKSLDYIDALNKLTDERALPWHKCTNEEEFPDSSILNNEFCHLYHDI